MWHDDVRPPPDLSWQWVTNNTSAQALLSGTEVVECSLDHDLGAVPTGETDPREVMYLAGDSREGSGLDLVRWMVEHDKVPSVVTIHSWNAPGAERMAAELRAAGHEVVVRPFTFPGANWIR